MTAHIVNRSAAENELLPAVRGAGSGASRRRPAQRLSRDSPKPACRPGASRLGTIRICAPLMADAAPILPAPTPADIEAARGRLAGRERFAAGAQLVLLGGRYIAELSDRLPAGVAVVEGAVAADAVDDPLAALNEALSPAGCTISVDARGQHCRADHDGASGDGTSVPFGLFADGDRARGRSARLIRRDYSKALMPGCSDTRRRS